MGENRELLLPVQEHLASPHTKKTRREQLNCTGRALVALSYGA